MNKKLTNREKQVLEYILKGYSNKEIAQELFISQDTAKAHVSSILYKTNTQDRLKLILKLLDKNVEELINTLK
jgi:DNA-binding NarL/FixJ family response regulator